MGYSGLAAFGSAVHPDVMQSLPRTRFVQGLTIVSPPEINGPRPTNSRLSALRTNQKLLEASLFTAAYRVARECLDLPSGISAPGEPRGMPILGLGGLLPLPAHAV